MKVNYPPKEDVSSSKTDITSPPKVKTSSARMPDSIRQGVVSPPRGEPVSFSKDVIFPPSKGASSPPKKDFNALKKQTTSPPEKKSDSPSRGPISPPVSVAKVTRTEPKVDENSIGSRGFNRANSIANEVKPDRSPSVGTEERPVGIGTTKQEEIKSEGENEKVGEESNGVGDKIKKFEKAAEDASASLGRVARTGSIRRTRADCVPAGELSPPAALPSPLPPQSALDRHSAVHGETPHASVRFSRPDIALDTERVRPETQRIIRPEFKPIQSPVDVTIRSPSLGAKIADRFPSHGTAFRNVASPRPDEDQTDHRTCKFKNKEKYSVSKGSSYFTRGSEEIWLVKKKDIEEIEERVLDSFRRAGGNMCVREGGRAASEGGRGAATMGRNKRQMYARSESLDPQWAGGRAHTLKRQTSVACTCGHDKKTRPKSTDNAQRPRSRSHGDDDNQTHVLDKYETLV